jgi:uncharacterized protein with LGFP repeats
MSPMDLVRRRRDAVPATPAAPSPTVAERVVARTSGFLSGGSTRRRFLARTAIVGSALAVNPFDFLLKPGTAYGAVCGTCSDGWTAFCCTINSGRNSCPPASFVAGWWKADGSAYCGGGPRYIIDCNATCPTQCACRCAGAACDGRRTCCNQFRYGQCNQHISCYGPVVCRVAICTTPWTYDPACSTYTLTDNKTRDHGAACLTQQPPETAIQKKYRALGGAGGILGRETQSERATPDGKGKYTIYQNGRIYWSSATGAWEIHGSIFDVWRTNDTTSGPFGFPTSDVQSHSTGIRYSRFQKGAIYRLTNGQTYGIPEPYYSVYQQYGGIANGGALGLPTSVPIRSADQRAVYINFQRGRIYRRSQVTVEIHGAIFDKHEALGGVHGALGHVQTSVGDIGDGRGKASIFEHGGVIYYTPTTGARGVWGSVLGAYLDGGGPTALGYPTTDRQAVGDGRGTTFTTEKVRVYATDATGAFVVAAPILAEYLEADGPTGSLGYPTGKAQTLSAGVVRQAFEGGVLEVTSPFVPFVKAAYADFLGRAPSAESLDHRVGRLLSGATSKATFIRELTVSSEYLSRIVQGFYQDTLGRNGSSADVAFWVGRIQSGRMTVAQVAASFYASAEYFSGIGGGTNPTWVADLYQKLLGRTAPQSDIDYWAAEAAAKGRSNVALRFFQSPESRATRVRGLYQMLLGRTPSSTDVSYWSPRILTQGDLALATTLASMQEYFDRAQTRFPT